MREEEESHSFEFSRRGAVADCASDEPNEDKGERRVWADAQKVGRRALVKGERALDAQDLDGTIDRAVVEHALARRRVERLRVQPRAHDVDWVDDGHVGRAAAESAEAVEQRAGWHVPAGELLELGVRRQQRCIPNTLRRPEIVSLLPEDLQNKLAWE